MIQTSLDVCEIIEDHVTSDCEKGPPNLVVFIDPHQTIVVLVVKPDATLPDD
jgi:hypothetical protein